MVDNHESIDFKSTDSSTIGISPKNYFTRRYRKLLSNFNKSIAVNVQEDNFHIGRT